ncbi:MAG TPA: hypothetical protein VK755_08360 [Candidatus Acidoferrales bacterium]|jgi:hypothetical protein|nr:hypothetical protein [Candidatus Acidoferrales bacterium]
MKHSGYTLKYSLIRMPIRGHLAVIDNLLDAGVLMPEERRELLMNHELLAATVEFFLMNPLMAQDKRGFAYVPLKRGKRAYHLDQFLECLERDPEHLARLTSLVREALFARFVQDVAAAA